MRGHPVLASREARDSGARWDIGGTKNGHSLFPLYIAPQASAGLSARGGRAASIASRASCGRRHNDCREHDRAGDGDAKERMPRLAERTVASLLACFISTFPFPSLFPFFPFPSPFFPFPLLQGRT